MDGGPLERIDELEKELAALRAETDHKMRMAFQAGRTTARNQVVNYSKDIGDWKYAHYTEYRASLERLKHGA